MPNVAEAELLARWRAGDDAAGREVCERHAQLVARIVAAHRPRTTTVDDLAQEVFMTLFARSERYQQREDTPFAHWLSRLTVNVCRDRLKAESRQPLGGALSSGGQQALEWLASGADEARHEAQAAREVVHVLFAELAPADRLVLTLVDIEGRPTAEVASLTGWSCTLVKVRAFRARRRLREIALRRERRRP